MKLINQITDPKFREKDLTFSQLDKLIQECEWLRADLEATIKEATAVKQDQMSGTVRTAPRLAAQDRKIS